jgi:hypothetical protein
LVEVSADRKRGLTRLVIYTVLIGSKEPLGNPLAILPEDATSDLNLRFVCFTDDPSQPSSVWTMRPIGMNHLPPEKLSRRPKAMPHEYFPDDEFSLYIDNTVKFKRLPQSSDLPLPPGPPMRGFKHATRNNPREEAMAVAMLGYDDTATLVRQMDFYKSQGPLEDLTPLTTGTVLMRRHHEQSVRQFGTIWWENILAFSKRDQLSIAYALQSAGLDVGYYPGITRDNEFVHWAGSLSPDRVKANFDDKRYAWIHRDDPEAHGNPRGHFLKNGVGDDSRYMKHSDLLEYLCFDLGSSLGSFVPPRRRLAHALQSTLQPFRTEAVNYLMVRVRDEQGPMAYEAHDLEKSAQALSMFLSPSKGTVFDLEQTELEQGTTVYKKTDVEYALVIAIGLSGDLAAGFAERFKRVLGQDSGCMVMLTSSGVSAAQVGQSAECIEREVRHSPDAWAVDAAHDTMTVTSAEKGMLVLRWPALGT